MEETKPEEAPQPAEQQAEVHQAEEQQAEEPQAPQTPQPWAILLQRSDYLQRCDET